jgi:1,4-alpha-glucan branching enzyme
VKQHVNSFIYIVFVGLLIGSNLLACSAMNAIKDRLPPPHRVEGGILFQYDAPAAQRVNLAGEFNDWGGTLIGPLDPSRDPMTKNEKGIWEIVIPLKPGRYEYKFVLDGGVVWKHDPNNAERVDDSFGGYNSVIVIK